MGNTPCFASTCNTRICCEWRLGNDTIGFYMSLLKRTVFFILLILSSCSKRELEPPREIPLPKEPAAIYHEVLFHGETLSLIAAWYTGDSRNWKTIADFNPGLNPNNISIRDIIKIPKSIVKKEKSFTQSEFQAMQKSVRKRPSLLEQSINPQNLLDADLGTPETYGEKEQYEGMSKGQTGANPTGDSRLNQASGSPADEASLERRNEIREKTRYELLQEMLEGEK